MIFDPKDGTHEHACPLADADVEAIVAGAKTRHTVPVWPQPDEDGLHDPTEDGYSGPIHDVHERVYHCPLGHQGSRLWVQEAWASADKMYQGHECDPPGAIAYRATKSAIQWNADPPRSIPGWDLATWNWRALRWQPRTKMRRRDARIFLEVCQSGFGRLHEISEKHADAEGVVEWHGLVDDASIARRAAEMHTNLENGRVWFAEIWDMKHGRRAPWASNPWVWFASFKVVVAVPTRSDESPFRERARRAGPLPHSMMATRVAT